MKTKKMVGIGLFTAIVVVLQMLAHVMSGMLPVELSFVLVPVVVGAAIYGWQAGAWLGFVFGVVVLLSGGAAAFLAVNVPGTILTVLLKGTLCGLSAGLVYKLFEKKNVFLAVMLAAVVCPIVNTGIYLLGCLMFFMNLVTDEWGFGDIGGYIIYGAVLINFLVELVVNIVLAPVAMRLIKIGKK